MIHDIALQKLHAVFVLDRAGAVPGDGETHQGLFDIALFRPVPGVKILSPASASDLKCCLEYACSDECSLSAVVIRYPKASCPSDCECFSSPPENGKGILVKAEYFEPSLSAGVEIGKNQSVLFVVTGGMYHEALTAARALLMEDIYADIYSMRFIKPVDEEYFINIARSYDALVFVEDGIKTGGVSEYLAAVCASNGILKFCIKAFAEKFYSQGTRTQVLEQAFMTAEDLKNAAENILKG